MMSSSSCFSTHLAHSTCKGLPDQWKPKRVRIFTRCSNSPSQKVVSHLEHPSPRFQIFQHRYRPKFQGSRLTTRNVRSRDVLAKTSGGEYVTSQPDEGSGDAAGCSDTEHMVEDPKSSPAVQAPACMLTLGTQFLKTAATAILLALAGTLITSSAPAAAVAGGGGGGVVCSPLWLLPAGWAGPVAACLRLGSRLVLLGGLRKLLHPLWDTLLLRAEKSSAGGNLSAKSPVVFHCTRAWRKFKSQWKGAVAIPFIAAFVGWFTNWLAVKMIFLPVEFWGVALKQYVVGNLYGIDVMQPLGLFGWQGIVPAKAGDMAFRMVTMVTTRLVDVAEVFARLDPQSVARLLQPEIPSLAVDIGREVLDRLPFPLPPWLSPQALLTHLSQGLGSLDPGAAAFIEGIELEFLAGFTQELQRNTDRVIDLKELVVKELAGGLEGKRRLSELFQICGRAELAFLTNSGLWFGFLLGIIQMVLWMFWDNPWTLTFGGAVVGYATNWMALKCIFEPVEPVQVGPFVLQGLFLKRQQQVAGEFSDFVTAQVLTSEKIWRNMLEGSKGDEFRLVLEEYIQKFSASLAERYLAAGELAAGLNPEHFTTLARQMADRLPQHIHVLHSYIDSTLGLQVDMRERMKLMTSAEFEQVLHPIFQEDEMTLIVSGAVLGAIAGAIQQYLTVAGENKPDEGSSDDDESDSSSPASIVS